MSNSRAHLMVRVKRRKLRRRRKRCPKHGVSLNGIWHRRGMCPICWVRLHPLLGYCMLCGEPTHETWRERSLCDRCEHDFRALFGRSRVRIPLRTVDDVRDVVAFAALRIYSNLDLLEKNLTSL